MRVIFDLALWTFKHCFKAIVLLLVVLVIGFAWQHISAQMNEIGNIEKIQKLANAEALLDRQLNNLRRDIRDLEANMPSIFSPIDRFYHKKNIKFKRRSLKELESLKNNTYHERYNLDQKTNALARVLYNFIEYAKKHYLVVISGILALILLPLVLKFILYYILAGNLGKSQPVKLTQAINQPDPDTMVGAQASKLEVEIHEDRPFTVKQGYLAAHDNQGCKKETKWIWSKKYWLLSLAAGLHNMTRVYLGKDQSVPSKVIMTTEDPDSQIVEIKLENHPGIVIRPSAVAGTSGSIKLRSKWVLNNLNSLITGQIRYLIFHGTGSVYVEGFKGIESNQPGANNTSIDQDKLLGFDSRLLLKASRTETFWPYLRGREALVEYSFSGPYDMLYELGSLKKEKDGVTSFFNTMLSSIGKVFGL